MEEHIFDDINFFPNKMRVLILGTFPVPLYTNREKFEKLSCREKENAWYYASKRSEFWKIISYSFDIDYNYLISSKQNKKKLFEENKVGIADVFSKCERKNKDSARDTNLIILEYNNILSKVLSDENYDLKLIIFTSRFTENNFFNIINTIGYSMEKISEAYDYYIKNVNDNIITIDIINALRERYLYINEARKIKLATITLKISPIKGVSLYCVKKELYKYYLNLY